MPILSQVEAMYKVCAGVQDSWVSLRQEYTQNASLNYVFKNLLKEKFSES